MTGQFFLDWAVLTVSLFNTILLFWLGLTVLLNAERRTFGLWLAAGALLLGGLFFLSHSAIVGSGPIFIATPLDFWWHLGWVLLTGLPFAWYAIMLWYNGFWEKPASSLYLRHRPPFGITFLLALGILFALAFFNPLPSAAQLIQYKINAAPSVRGVPLLILAYPFYCLLCTGLSLDVLRRPSPTPLIMGNLARQRARPWLVGASLALSLVSLLVGAAVAWIVFSLNARRTDPNLVISIAWFDLVIASLIALITLLVGQAIVAYEIFTGKTLPRRGLLRYWRRAIILALGFSAVTAGGLLFGLPRIYNLLLSVLVVTLFFAFLSWRAFSERDRTIESLRPFVTAAPGAQRLSEQILEPLAAKPDSLSSPFEALCRDVLGTLQACLLPSGLLAPLAGPPLTYPAHMPLPDLSLVSQLSASSSELCLPLDPASFSGYRWAVPLWADRGQIGMFLLGEKNDGSLYTQEEIEIARSAAERLMDTQVGLEMAHRLAALQRQRLAESQVLDRRARRVLHDDILPDLHAAMLSLSAATEPAQKEDGLSTLAAVHRKIAGLLRELPPAVPEVSRLGVTQALRLLLEREHAQDFEQVRWLVDPAAEQGLATLPPWLAEVLYYAAREGVRNAARHARGEKPDAPLHLQIALRWQEGLLIEIADNGVGISTQNSNNAGDFTHPSTLPAGSGQGLALHSTLMAVAGGTLEIIPDTPGTRLIIRLPASAWQNPDNMAQPPGTL